MIIEDGTIFSIAQNAWNLKILIQLEIPNPSQLYSMDNILSHNNYSYNFTSLILTIQLRQIKNNSYNRYISLILRMPMHNTLISTLRNQTMNPLLFSIAIIIIRNSAYCHPFQYVTVENTNEHKCMISTITCTTIFNNPLILLHHTFCFHFMHL